MENKAYRGHVLALPYPSQGHINPLLQFSKRLVSKGLKATLATTLYIHNTMQSQSSSSLQFDTISDGYDEGGFAQAESIHAYLNRMETIGSETLAELIIKNKNTANPIDCIIYDPFLPWALEVAKKFGIFGAAFFTQTCAVNFIYYHVHHGLLKLPITSTPISIPGLPVLELEDIPPYISVPGSYPAYFEMVLNQFSSSDKADAVLVNTFYELEAEVGNYICLYNFIFIIFVLEIVLCECQTAFFYFYFIFIISLFFCANNRGEESDYKGNTKFKI